MMKHLPNDSRRKNLFESLIYLLMTYMKCPILGTDAKTIKCLAEDVDVELSMPGKFEWLIGGEIIENDNEPTIDDDSALEHTLNYEPKIEDDGKSVVCRYVMGLKTIPFFVESQDEADNRCLVQLLKSAI